MKIFNCFDSLACFVGLNLILKTKKHPFRFENSKHYGTVSHQVFKMILHHDGEINFFVCMVPHNGIQCLVRNTRKCEKQRFEDFKKKY